MNMKMSNEMKKNLTYKYNKFTKKHLSNDYHYYNMTSLPNFIPSKIAMNYNQLLTIHTGQERNFVKNLNKRNMQIKPLKTIKQNKVQNPLIDISPNQTIEKNQKKVNVQEENKKDINEENNTNEMKEIAEYFSKINYNDYIKDLEIREAFQLIKNKMMKDKMINENNITNEADCIIETNEKKDKDNMVMKEQDVQHYFQEKDADLMKAAVICNKKEEESKFPRKELINNLQEIQKDQEPNDALIYHIAGKISKYDPLFNVVHSKRSIRMLFEREGLTNFKQINDIELSQRLPKYNQLKPIEKYIPNVLPFLHSTPKLN